MFSSFKQGKRASGGKNSRWFQKLKRLWNKNPHCHWCGIKTEIEDRHIPSKNGNGFDQKDNAATADHIYSNYDLRRLLSRKFVLACYRCNNKRSAAETRKVYSNDFDSRNNKISIIELLKQHHP